MKSTVELEVAVPRETLAPLYADPTNNTKWMDDVARCEPISGQLGMPGSQYRVVPKKGDMVFVATVIARELPHELRLSFEAKNVVVAIRATFVPLAREHTRLVSEEVFTFKGLKNRIIGVFATRAIRKVHRRHIEAFKRFAERRERGDE